MNLTLFIRTTNLCLLGDAADGEIAVSTPNATLFEPEYSLAIQHQSLSLVRCASLDALPRLVPISTTIASYELTNIHGPPLSFRCSYLHALLIESRTRSELGLVHNPPVHLS